MVPPHKPDQRALGHTAIVVGASVAGLSVAAALAKHFERVLLLERDALPLSAAQRPSVPQGWHVHTLVAGGLHALERLLPGITSELSAAGAAQITWDLDVLIERVAFDTFPRRDCGFFSLALSRPLLEGSLRARVRALPNVELIDEANVQRIVPDLDTLSARAVQWKHERSSLEERSAELVVDCSGRSDLTLQLFRELSLPAPPESVVGVGLSYSSALFEHKPPADWDWKAVLTLANAPLASACGLLAPIESEAGWLVSVGGREAERPPGDADGFRAYVRALRTPTIARALDGARMLREPVRFGFPASRRRHFERAEALPKRWLALGDAWCRFNPIYGQGMGVAALQAEELAASLQRTAAGTQGFEELCPSVVTGANAIVESAWNASAIPDFVYRQTMGERPRDLRERLLRTNAVLRLAVEDAEVHRLAARVTHLLDWPEVLRTHELNQRIRTLMERGLGQAVVNSERS